MSALLGHTIERRWLYCAQAGATLIRYISPPDPIDRLRPDIDAARLPDGRSARRANGLTFRPARGAKRPAARYMCLLIVDAVVGDDGGQGDAAEVGQGAFVVSGGDGPPMFESVETSLNGVAVLVDSS